MFAAVILSSWCSCSVGLLVLGNHFWIGTSQKRFCHFKPFIWFLWPSQLGVTRLGSHLKLSSYPYLSPYILLVGSRPPIVRTDVIKYTCTVFHYLEYAILTYLLTPHTTLLLAHPGPGRISNLFGRRFCWNKYSHLFNFLKKY